MRPDTTAPTDDAPRLIVAARKVGKFALECFALAVFIAVLGTALLGG